MFNRASTPDEIKTILSNLIPNPHFTFHTSYFIHNYSSLFDLRPINHLNNCNNNYLMLYSIYKIKNYIIY